MVSAARADGEACGLRARAGHVRHKALRVRDLGACPARPRRPLQGDGPQERLLPAADPRELHEEGGRPRRGLRPGAGVGDDRGQGGAGGAARHSSHLREHHLRLLQELDPELPRPAHPDKPVVQRAALGEGHPSLPEDRRVPLAGGPHRPRDRRGRARGDAADARRLPRLLLRGHGHPRPNRREEPVGAFRGGGRDLHLRGLDGRRARAAGGDQPRPRAELRPRLRHHLSRREPGQGPSLPDLVGLLHAHHRGFDPGPR